jgi:8-oxo-dGTP pyrophosphatase MutT (NUDIX family)
MTATPREVARALLFRDNELVLIHWRDPLTGAEFLEPPGGEREPGESWEQALQRELAEEAGVSEVEVGPLVACIDHNFTFAGEYYECVERYYLCRLAGPGRVELDLDVVESSGIVGTRWLTTAEVEALPARRLQPPQLKSILCSLSGGSIDS